MVIGMVIGLSKYVLLEKALDVWKESPFISKGRHDSSFCIESFDAENTGLWAVQELHLYFKRRGKSIQRVGISLEVNDDKVLVPVSSLTGPFQHPIMILISRWMKILLTLASGFGTVSLTSVMAAKLSFCLRGLLFINDH